MSYASTILADNPTAYYRMNDSSGTTAFDLTSNGYNATVSGATLGQSGLLAGDSDTCMAFTAGGGLTVPPTLSNLIASWSALSLEFWINLDGISHYVVMVASGSAVTLYLDNAATSDYSGAEALFTSDLDEALFGSLTLAGSIDEVAVYNYDISPRISTHYSAGINQVASFGTIYSYGAFQLNLSSGGLGYFLIGKDLDFPTYKPTLSPVARQDLWKINGWQLDNRQIQVDLIVVGTSRLDCIARLDALFQALALRDQQLVLHEDGRYWVANATTGKVKFAGGSGVTQAKVPVTFLCANPFASAASTATPFDTGSLAYTLSGSDYLSPTLTFPGGGTAYSWPQIHLVHKTPLQGFTTLSTALVQGTSYTSLSVVSSPTLAAGQLLVLYYSPAGVATLFTQKVTTSAAVTAGAASIPVNAFTAAWPFTSGTSVFVSTAWNQVTILQLTDNYILSVVSTTSVPLPQTNGDFLDIYTAPDTGMYVSTNRLSQVSDPVGAFPPLEPGNTSWQVVISADYPPTVDASWIWTPRFQN